MTAGELRQKMWRTVTNRSLSTWLLMVLTAVLVMGSLLPNPEYMTADAVADLKARSPRLFEMGSNFNSRKLATGYFFGLTGIYLIVSATLCSIDRLLNRRREEAAVVKETGGAPGDVTIVVPAVHPEETREYLAGRLRRTIPGRIAVQETVGDALIFRRGRYGFWGSVIFHTVLITALSGLVMFHLGGTRGKLVFTEGQRYPLERSRFVYLEKEPFWGLRLPRAELELVAQYSLYAHDDPRTAVDHLARFRVTDLERGVTSIRDVKINSPLRLGGKDFLLMTGGFAPRFVISGRDGKVLFDSFVTLKREAGTIDSFRAAGLAVEVRFFPDLGQEGGRPMTKSLMLHNPAALITVTGEGKKVFEQVVPLGATTQAAGYTFAVPEVRRWVELEMANEPGIGFFFVISFFGILGILMRLLDPDEELVIVTRPDLGGTRVDFFVNSRHFSALLTELARDCARSTASWGADKAKGRET